MATTKIPTERKTSELTPEELAMLRTTSKLSDKEIKLWYSGFMNKHPTGKLDKNRFVELFNGLYSPENTHVPPETLFDMVDTNKDGTIDFNEFLFLAAVTERHGNLDDRLDFIFNLWDVSGDGLLDPPELAHLISAIYDHAGVKDRQGDNNPQTRARAIIKKLDINKDKRLSKEEFINGCKNDEVIGKFLAAAE